MRKSKFAVFVCETLKPGHVVVGDSGRSLTQTDNRCIGRETYCIITSGLLTKH